MYKSFLRPLLFLFGPEAAHQLVFGILKFACRIPGIRNLLRGISGYEHPSLARELFGVTFKNPVGLAAGFDKDARLINELACLGFGFIEIGTLTPRPQPGNDKPRLFRLPDDHALINRMGFNNRGVRSAVEYLKKRNPGIIIGGNIGKNKITPNEEAGSDYAYCFDVLYDYVDYFVVNVSSPNTPGLRALQEKEPLEHLLEHLKELRAGRKTQKAILLKIAPDLTGDQLDDIVASLQKTGIDGVIATNTSVTRSGLRTDPETLNGIGNGGLSGAPIAERSTEVIRHLRSALGPDFPIIGVGGIMSEEQALEKLRAGADLVQVYTGFIYEGPALVKRINKAIAGMS